MDFILEQMLDSKKNGRVKDLSQNTSSFSF